MVQLSFTAGFLEELSDRSEHFFLPSHDDLAFRQRIEKNLSVGFFQDSAIENHDGAPVCFTANQAAEALFEFDDCLWN